MKNIFYVTNDPERALGLEKILPNFHIISIDGGHIVDSLERDDRNIFSLSKASNDPNPLFRNSNKLLNHELALEYINKHSKDGDENYIMVFKIAPNTEMTISDMGFLPLNTSAELNQKYENKISQYKALSNLEISIPKSVVARLEDLDHYDLKEELGNTLVVQYDRGHTGIGTHFIYTEKEFETLKQKFPKRSVKVSEFIKGDIWTLNAVCTEFGTHYGGLSYQITGIPELTMAKGATVGNNWGYGKKLTDDVLSQIHHITNTVGDEMYKDDYKGLFGLDFAISPENIVVLLEINARQPASTGMHTKLMLMANEVPLELLHIAAFLYEDTDSKVYFINNTLDTDYTIASLAKQLQSQDDLLGKNLNASQFVIRNKTPDDVVTTSEIKPGVYSLEGKYVRGGYSVEDLKDDNEYLLLSVPAGRIVSPTTELGRVQMLGDVQLDKKMLKPEFKEVIKEITLSTKLAEL